MDACRIGPRVADPGQVHGALQGPVLARAAVTAHQHRIDLQAAPLQEPSGLRASLEAQLPRLRRDPGRVVLGLAVRGHAVPSTRLRPIENQGGRACLSQEPGGLEPGQHADVMLRRRTAE